MLLLAGVGSFRHFIRFRRQLPPIFSTIVVRQHSVAAFRKKKRSVFFCPAFGASLLIEIAFAFGAEGVIASGNAASRSLPKAAASAAEEL